MKTKTKQFFCYSFITPIITLAMGVFLLPSPALASEITNEELIKLTNQERAQNNLNALTANQLLTQAAYQKGEDILKNQTFEHTINNKKFSTWIKNVGYKYSYVGENLAIDFVTNQGIVNAWMASPEHKKNILNEHYTEIGIATLSGKFNNQDTVVVVQMFGTPPKEMLTPNLLGMEGQNFIKLNSSTPTQSYLQNSLTHSTTNLLDINNINLEKQNISYSEVNNFFEQSIFESFFITVYSILILYLFIYTYFYSFSHLNLNNTYDIVHHI